MKENIELTFGKQSKHCLSFVLIKQGQSNWGSDLDGNRGIMVSECFWDDARIDGIFLDRFPVEVRQEAERVIEQYI